MKTLFRGMCAALTIAAIATAQGPLKTTDKLVGWVRSTPQGQIHIQDKSQPCRLDDRCPPPIHQTLANAGLGGTGYDARCQAVWTSNGEEICFIAIRRTPQDDCKLICRFKATRVFTQVQASVTGLAVGERRRRLWQLESIPGAFGIVRYGIPDPKKDCAKFEERCRAPLWSRQAFAGGLAYDEIRQLLYVGVTVRSTTGNSYAIVVLDPADPCRIVCRYQLQSPCLREMIRGVAYDACKGELVLTDGLAHQFVSVGDPKKCEFKVGECCRASGPYGGLALIPGWSARRLGKSCTGENCPTCPSMEARLTGGDASLGNPNFAIELGGAPAGVGRFALLLVKAGKCSTGLPFFCGQLYPFPLTAKVGPIPLPGTGCNGRVRFGFPIPANRAACGRTWCAQWAVICAERGRLGVGLSNALEFTIGTN